MNLIKLLTDNDKTIDQITKIYHGKENCCRCGCGGNYFDKGSRGFTRALNAMQKFSFSPLTKGEPMYASYGKCISEGIVVGDNYIDIPYDADHDKCYCLYFD